jgi:NADH-quinone oxidoreductase subunit A
MGSGPVPENYIPILIFIGAAIAVGSVTLFLGKFVRPNHPYRAKMAPYESGSPLFQDARVQFPMRYYIIAMLFVIFDIEIVFMFPWAVVFTKLGFWYAWKKGALEWE